MLAFHQSLVLLFLANRNTTQSPFLVNNPLILLHVSLRHHFKMAAARVVTPPLRQHPLPNSTAARSLYTGTSITILPTLSFFLLFYFFKNYLPPFLGAPVAIAPIFSIPVSRYVSPYLFRRFGLFSHFFLQGFQPSYDYWTPWWWAVQVHDATKQATLLLRVRVFIIPFEIPPLHLRVCRVFTIRLQPLYLLHWTTVKN
jgi:hypothetical protein